MPRPRRRSTSRLLRVLRSKFIVFFPAATIAFFAPAPANADTVGLNVSVYNIGYNIPPQRSDTAYPLCEGADTHYNNVQQGWGGGIVANCAYDRVMVHYSGYITIPEHQYNISFLIYSDDGGWVDVGGNEFGYWGDRGCGASWSGYLELPAGSYTFNDWFYENGGGACNSLYWSIDYGPWEPVPASAFSTEEPPPPTTTTTTIPKYLNTPTNLSGYSEDGKVYLNWDTPEASNVDVESYAILWSNDNWQTGYGIAVPTNSAVIESLDNLSNYQFKVRADNNTEGVYSAYSDAVEISVVPPTTTTTSTTTTTTEPPTTTTTEPPTTTTSTTSTTTTVVPTTTTTTEPPTTTTSTTIPPTTVPETTTTIPEVTTTTTVPDPEPLDNPTEQPVSEVVAALDAPGVTTEQVQEVVAELLATDIDSSQAAELATSAKVLESVTAEQAQEIFDAIKTSELSADEAEAIVEAVQNAPTKVKKKFENEINVFDKKFDNYVPVGSVVPVVTRRVIVAATTVLFVVPIPVPTSGPSPRKQ